MHSVIQKKLQQDCKFLSLLIPHLIALETPVPLKGHSELDVDDQGYHLGNEIEDEKDQQWKEKVWEWCRKIDLHDKGGSFVCSCDLCTLLKSIANDKPRVLNVLKKVKRRVSGGYPTVAHHLDNNGAACRNRRLYGECYDVCDCVGDCCNQEVPDYCYMCCVIRDAIITYCAKYEEGKSCGYYFYERGEHEKINWWTYEPKAKG